MQEDPLIKSQGAMIAEDEPGELNVCKSPIEATSGDEMLTTM